jgi:alkanesulfonate monooxygenase SsuD/methylene tetrahydromethanopterin reductase-like flavin-dependent oxidoreductase (luciferase family)
VRAEVLGRVSAHGRDPETFDTAYYMTVNLAGEGAGVEADAFIRGYYGVNFWGERWGPFGDPARVVERALSFVDAGADELIFRFAARDQRAQLELFAEHVLPALRRDRHGRTPETSTTRTGPPA